MITNEELQAMHKSKLKDSLKIMIEMSSRQENEIVRLLEENTGRCKENERFKQALKQIADTHPLSNLPSTFHEVLEIAQKALGEQSS